MSRSALFLVLALTMNMTNASEPSVPAALPAPANATPKDESPLGRATWPQPRAEVAAHRRLEREHAFVVELPLAEAFVLFTPVGEKNWAEGWRPVFMSPEDADLREGSVFTVTSAAPLGGDDVHSVWAVSRYAPPAAIEYRNVLIGLRATHIAVRCEALAEDAGAATSLPTASRARAHTRVTVRYVYHGLSEAGDAFIAQMTEEKFRAMIESWSAAVAEYWRRGTPATP